MDDILRSKSGPSLNTSRTLLLIEDDEIDRMAFIRAIRETTYKYDIADSCEEALQYIKERSYDLIISDIYLGDGRIFDILDDIRKSRTPLIVTTGSGDQETAVKALQSGAIDYLVKDPDRSYLRMLPVSVERALIRARETELLTTLGAAVEQTHAAISVSSQDLVITYFNPSQLQIVGGDAGQLSGAPLSSLFNDQKLFQEAVSTVKTGGVWTGEVAIPNSDGSVTWEYVTLSVITNQEGEREGYLRIAEDISRQKRAEFALESEKERLSITLRSIGDGVIAVSEAGKILYLNPSAQEFIVNPFESDNEMQISKVYLPLDPVSKELVPESDWPVDLSQTEKMGRYILNKINGEERIIDQHISPLPLPNGLTGKVITFRDITDRVRKEEERQRLSQLESLGILAGGIAHDLNNILTIILSNLLMVKDLAQETQILERITAAEMAVTRAKTLSKQFLTFSPGGEPVTEPIQLGQFLMSAPGGYIKGGDIQITYDIPSDIPLVKADPAQLGVAIHQIARNAVEAMSNSGKLEMRARRADPNEYGPEMVLIEIEDTGSGIQPDILPRVFEPYFSTKKEMKGLGLTTAHSIITRHNGKIRIKSIPDNGTTVLITLPIASETAPSLPKHDEVKGYRGNKVLIMDDEPGIREIISLMLRKMGYLVDTASDGKAALNSYSMMKEKGDEYALVIMDLIIPGGLGGKETIKLLRQRDSDIPVIVSSGYSNDPIMGNYLDYGFNDSLPKPYNFKFFKDKMSEWAPIT